MPDVDHLPPSQALEREHIIPAHDPLHRVRMEFLLAAVESGLDDEQRPDLSGIIGLVEVTGERGVPVRDGDDLVRDGIKGKCGTERVPALLPRCRDPGV